MTQLVIHILLYRSKKEKDAMGRNAPLWSGMLLCCHGVVGTSKLWLGPFDHSAGSAQQIVEAESFSLCWVQIKHIASTGACVMPSPERCIEVYEHLRFIYKI